MHLKYLEKTKLNNNLLKKKYVLIAPKSLELGAGTGWSCDFFSTSIFCGVLFGYKGQKISIVGPKIFGVGCHCFSCNPPLWWKIFCSIKDFYSSTVGGKKRAKSKLRFLNDYLFFCQMLWGPKRQSTQVFFRKFLSTLLHPFGTFFTLFWFVGS